MKLRCRLLGFAFVGVVALAVATCWQEVERRRPWKTLRTGLRDVQLTFQDEDTLVLDYDRMPSRIVERWAVATSTRLSHCAFPTYTSGNGSAWSLSVAGKGSAVFFRARGDFPDEEAHVVALASGEERFARAGLSALRAGWESCLAAYYADRVEFLDPADGKLIRTIPFPRDGSWANPTEPPWMISPSLVRVSKGQRMHEVWSVTSESSLEARLEAALPVGRTPRGDLVTIERDDGPAGFCVGVRALPGGAIVRRFGSGSTAVFHVGTCDSGTRILVLRTATVEVYDVETGERLRSVPRTSRTTGAWNSVAVSPDGGILAQGSDGGLVDLWKIP